MLKAQREGVRVSVLSHEAVCSRRSVAASAAHTPARLMGLLSPPYLPRPRMGELGGYFQMGGLRVMCCGALWGINTRTGPPTNGVMVLGLLVLGVVRSVLSRRGGSLRRTAQSQSTVSPSVHSTRADK